MNTEKLYNSSGTQFYPETHASSVISEAITGKTSVEDALTHLNNTLQRALDQYSGATTINGALSGASVEYGKGGITYQSVNQWLENPVLPDDANPYCWAKLTLIWTVNDQDFPLSPIYIATAVAGAETQVMYTSVGLSSSGLQGPSAYSTGENGSDDASGANNVDGNKVKWYAHFKGIDGSAAKKYGYMAIRTREAGQQFTGWNVALFAMYPTLNDNN